MEDMGLVGANGETIDVFAAVGIDEDGVAKAIEELSQGLVPIQIASFMSDYEDKYRGAQEQYEAQWRDVISTQLQFASQAHSANLPQLQDSFDKLRVQLQPSGDLNPVDWSSTVTQFNSMVESAFSAAARQMEVTGEQAAVIAVKNLNDAFTSQNQQVETLLAKVAEARNAGNEESAAKLQRELEAATSKVRDSFETNSQTVYREVSKNDDSTNNGPVTGKIMP